jgi:hypothetical protein
LFARLWRRRAPPAADHGSSGAALCLLPSDLLQSVIQSLRPTDLVAAERVCTRLRHVVGAHPFAAWLRNNSNQMDEAWLHDDDEMSKAQSEWGHPRLCAALARDGRLDLLRWVRSHDPPCLWGWQTGWEAFKRIDQEMLDWLAAHEYDPKEALKWDVGMTVSADAGDDGDLPLLKWLDMHEHNYKFLPYHEHNGSMESQYRRIASNGRLDVLRWLHEQNSNLPFRWLCQGAAEGGHIHVLGWLNDYLGSMTGDDGDMMSIAVERGHLHVVQWLTEHGVEMVTDPTPR